MNKFLLSTILCLSLNVAVSPMEPQAEVIQRDEHTLDLTTLIAWCPDALQQVVTHLGGASFSALTQVSKACQKVCDNIPTSWLMCITCIGAATHGNANLTRRYLNEYLGHPERVLFVPLLEEELLKHDFANGMNSQFKKYTFSSLEILNVTHNFDHYDGLDGSASLPTMLIKINDTQRVLFQVNSFKAGMLMHSLIDNDTDFFVGEFIPVLTQNFPKEFSLDFSNQEMNDLAAHGKGFLGLGIVDVCNQANYKVVIIELDNPLFYDSMRAETETLCLNGCFLLAAKNNHGAVIEVFLQTPLAFERLTLGTMEIAADLSTDEVIKQVLKAVQLELEEELARRVA